jgi:Zn-dependent protease with chaperone function
VRHAAVHGLHYLTVIVVCLLAVSPLSRAGWATALPRLAIGVWQALLLSVVTSTVGLAWAIGLAPYRLGEAAAFTRLAGDVVAGRPTPLTVAHGAATGIGLLFGAVSIAAVVRYGVAVLRARARHRYLLAVVGTRTAAAGVTVLEHPAVAAYCLPGRRSDIVVSAGAVRLLSPGQLDAVVAHERAHAVARHDLVLMPFAALRRGMPRSRLVTCMSAAVETLVEMSADDRAIRHSDRRSLHDALARFATQSPAGLPRGALGAAAGVTQRLHRLAYPPVSPPAWAVAAVVLTALFVASTPLSLLILPWWSTTSYML